MIALQRVLSVCFLAGLLAIAGPASLHAASDAGSDSHQEAAAHHDAAHHVASVGDLLFPALNFAIYLVIVIRYLIPAMREYLRRRRADIMEAESESSAALARAEQSVAVSKARLAALPAEADAIRQDLITIATRQAERLVAQAEESGSRRLTDAALVAEQERRRAMADVRAEIATAATTLAERKIRAALTPDDQRSFVQQFLTDATPR